jgi:hypothetical protein
MPFGICILESVNVKFCGYGAPEKNTRYAIMQNINGSVHELQKAVLNVLEHHFGEHSGCGAWCPAVRWKDDPEKRESLVYCNKAKDRILYDQLEATRAPFLTLDRLQEMMSKFNTAQKNENTMMVITGTVPKTTFFAATICGKGRTYLAVDHDSTGTIDYFSRLYLMLGIEMTSTLRDHFITAEEARRNDKEYKKNLNVAKKRAIKKSEASQSQYNNALRDTLAKLYYEPGVVMAVEEERPSPMLDEQSENNENARKNKCKYGSRTHQRTTSKKCPLRRSAALDINVEPGTSSNNLVHSPQNNPPVLDERRNTVEPSWLAEERETVSGCECDSFCLCILIF